MSIEYVCMGAVRDEGGMAGMCFVPVYAANAVCAAGAFVRCACRLDRVYLALPRPFRLCLSLLSVYAVCVYIGRSECMSEKAVVGRREKRV